MKTTILVLVSILIAGAAFGQSIKSGSLIGTHVCTITLKEGATMDQYVKFYTTRVIPETEKLMPGMKLFLVKGIRGEKRDSFGLIFVFESAQVRDKYNRNDGSTTDLGQSIAEKLKPIYAELTKLGTMKRTYTDWIVQ